MCEDPFKELIFKALKEDSMDMLETPNVFDSTKCNEIGDKLYKKVINLMRTKSERKIK